MNKNDRGNLAFIISRTLEGPESLDEFLNILEYDDLEYALELLEEYKSGQKKLVDSLLDWYFT